MLIHPTNSVDEYSESPHVAKEGGNRSPVSQILKAKEYYI